MLAMLMRKVRSVLPDLIGLSSQNGLDLEGSWINCPALPWTVGGACKVSSDERQRQPGQLPMDGNLGWLGIALGQRAQNPADSEVVVHPAPQPPTYSTAHG